MLFILPPFFVPKIKNCCYFSLAWFVFFSFIFSLLSLFLLFFLFSSKCYGLMWDLEEVKRVP